MNVFESAYLNIIFEENYSDDNWDKHGSYKGIDFYIRKDGHLQKRLKERYENKITLSKIIFILNHFIKNELKENGKLLNDEETDFSYTVYEMTFNIYISGRFKKNKNIWRCYISTVLPNKDAHFSRNDYFKMIKI